MCVPYNTPKLVAWIRENTRGAFSVVDFGAGFFDKLACVSPITKRIGIEVFPPYASSAPPGVTAVCGNILDWELYVSESDRDTAMLIDVIEHLPKEEGVTLLRELQQHFKRILVFTPDGFYEQDFDETGYGNEYQIHLCGYTGNELAALGFTVSAVPDFHGDKGGALFAVWRRE